MIALIAARLFVLSALTYIALVALGTWVTSYAAADSATFIATGNEASHIELLRGLVEDGSFEITSDIADMSGVNDKLYSNKPPGYAFMLWPMFELFSWIAGVDEPSAALFYVFGRMFNALLASAIVTVVYLYLSTYALSTPARIFGSGAVGYATFLPASMTFATSSSACVFLALAALYLTRRHAIAERPSSGPLIWASALMALTFICDYKMAAFLLPLAGAVAYRLMRTGGVAVLAAGTAAAVPLAALAYYNVEVFGEALVLSYSRYLPPSYVPWPGIGGAFTLSAIPHGAWQLLVGTARGMLPLSPVIGLGIIGLVQAWRTGERHAALPALMALSGFLFVSSYVFWFGGHAVGYRHVLTSAILLSMFSAFTLDAARKWRWAAAVCVLVLGVSTAFSMVAWRVQLDGALMAATWSGPPNQRLGNFFTDLMIPCLSEADRCTLPD